MRQRQRVQGVDAGTQADEGNGEWTAFDLGRAMSCLHSGDEAIVRRTLRRLHIRFWHHGANRMREILKHAGAPKQATDLVQEIVDTCKICRMWKRPTPKAATSTRLATCFNDTVQWDILFL